MVLGSIFNFMRISILIGVTVTTALSVCWSVRHALEYTQAAECTIKTFLSSVQANHILVFSVVNSVAKFPQYQLQRGVTCRWTIKKLQKLQLICCLYTWALICHDFPQYWLQTGFSLESVLAGLVDDLLTRQTSWEASGWTSGWEAVAAGRESHLTEAALIFVPKGLPGVWASPGYRFAYAQVMSRHQAISLFGTKIRAASVSCDSHHVSHQPAFGRTVSSRLLAVCPPHHLTWTYFTLYYYITHHTIAVSHGSGNGRGI